MKTLDLELATFRNNRLLCDNLNNIKTIAEFLQYLIISNSTVCKSFPNITKALILYMTLPVSNASAERSFSKLKLIKTFLRNRMTQERLDHLSILAIENDEAANIDTKESPNTFAQMQARKKH